MGIDRSNPSANAAKHPQRAGGRLLDEAAGRERREVDLFVRRSPAIGGIGEHVVDGEQAAGGHKRRPQLEIETGRLDPVAAVDEQEAKGSGPVANHAGAIANDGNHPGFEPSVVDGPAEGRQGVDPADRRIDQVRFVPLPAGLVLLRAPMVIDAEQQRVGVSGDRSEIEGRLAAVATDLEQRPERGIRRRGGTPQGNALIGRHEPPGGLGVRLIVALHQARISAACRG